jgi:uncharacterized GH25 family protein
MNKMLKLAALTLTAALPLSAEAHRSWILPSLTVLAGESPWVTFDAAVSTDTFIADHNPVRVDVIKIVAPDGTEMAPQNGSTLKTRGVFDLNLTQKGTWKVFTATSGLNARWEENGTRKFWPPRGATPTREAFEKEVPKQADKLEVTQTSRRVETFVTSGKVSTSVFKPTNVGLELVPVTHPNDLYAGESATFQFLMDGKAAAGLKVDVTPGERRYRNTEDTAQFTTDKDGKVTITWPGAGQFFVEADFEDGNAEKPATKRTGRYGAVVEVLPQ